MKSFVLLYSATSALDYRFITRPGYEDVPKPVSSEFEKNIKGLLSNETPITVPKWIFAKKYLDGIPYVLWGTACQNSTFSEEYSNDTKSRSIQCFIGVVIAYADEKLKLPFETLSLRLLFTSIMSKVWGSRDSSSIQCQVQIQSLNSTKYIYRSDGNALNYNSALCRLFPSSYIPIEVLFSEALASTKDISLASGIVTKAEVTTPEYIPLLNAVMIKDSSEVKDYPVMRLCCKCKKPSYTLKDGLCKNCINDINKPLIDNPIDYKNNPSKQRCASCGQECDELINGICQECRMKYNLGNHKKCGNIVNRIKAAVFFDKCSRWQTSFLLLLVFLLLLLLLKR